MGDQHTCKNVCQLFSCVLLLKALHRSVFSPNSILRCLKHTLLKTWIKVQTTFATATQKMQQKGSNWNTKQRARRTDKDQPPQKRAKKKKKKTQTLRRQKLKDHINNSVYLKATLGLEDCLACNWQKESDLCYGMKRSSSCKGAASTWKSKQSRPPNLLRIFPS